MNDFTIERPKKGDTNLEVILRDAINNYKYHTTFNKVIDIRGFSKVISHINSDFGNYLSCIAINRRNQI
ncbi:hypothetical protein [Bacillus badius]|uniref:hypothetical protein n=1 Tax=Bacillus badius TaxID=1455 RepID=UPI0007B3220A|nr:hypothetical protein [Bacillus badius]KZR59349.1 hypothetical protein A3781_13185 [Bacillus badius]